MNKLHHGALGCAEGRVLAQETKTKTPRSGQKNQTEGEFGGFGLWRGEMTSRTASTGRLVCNPCFYLFIFFITEFGFAFSFFFILIIVTAYLRQREHAASRHSNMHLSSG